MMAWAEPLEPRGYIGWAASPSSVTRPKVQRGTGSRSTIGYSKTGPAPSIRAGTSSQSKRQSLKMARKSPAVPGLFQSFIAAPSRWISATQLTSWLPWPSTLSTMG